jgi:hypothetical protein
MDKFPIMLSQVSDEYHTSSLLGLLGSVTPRSHESESQMEGLGHAHNVTHVTTKLATRRPSLIQQMAPRAFRYRTEQKAVRESVAARNPPLYCSIPRTIRSRHRDPEVLPDAPDCQACCSRCLPDASKHYRIALQVQKSKWNIQSCGHNW